MALRSLVRILGLCNAVAGALLLCVPSRLVPVEGIESAAAVLTARSAAVLLIAVAVGVVTMPASSTRPYLWTFGVGVKLAGAVIWASAAMESASAALWAGAAVDAAVAMVMTFGLLRAATPR